MKNYYFISSPLHFYIASNLAIVNQGQENTAVILAKNVGLAKSLICAIEHVKGVFSETISLVNEQGFGKLKHRRDVMKQIDKSFTSDSGVQIYTGNDRRIEFQYAMYVAGKSGNKATGIYMDDGAVSYVGHKSMHSYAHRVLDPFLKKVVYGRWWKNALTTGTSDWISKAYLAFPELAHPLLKQKQLFSLNKDIFSAEPVKQLSQYLLNESGIDSAMFADIKVLITLPHEDVYLHQSDVLKQVYSHLLKTYSPEDVAIKAHPRSSNVDLLDEIFPDSNRIDKNIGFEIILPLLGDGIVILGDISTTLLSAKWLRPDITVETMVSTKSSQQMDDLFKALGIRHYSME